MLPRRARVPIRIDGIKFYSRGSVALLIARWLRRALYSSIPDAPDVVSL